MTTGRRWNGTSGGRRENGDGWRRTLEGREWIRELQGGFMLRCVYVAVVQVVLLFGSNKWILTPWLNKYLKWFHHRLAQRMAGIGTKLQWDGT